MARKRKGLNLLKVDRLGAALVAFERAAPQVERIAHDPVEFPHRYDDPRDIELVGLLSAALAYGRVDLFKPKVAALLRGMGPSPSAFAQRLTVPGARALLDGFVYRFNVGTDIAVLLMGAGRVQRELGSLEALFVRELGAAGALKGALEGFIRSIREAAPLEVLRRALGRERGLHHLLPHPLGPGAAKRLNLYLRWMVRGPDEVDFGIWTRVSPGQLLIPLDTHIGRIAGHLGLTRRKDLSWKTAEEITERLRRVDPADPVRFDFALCHHGMSGACPLKPDVRHCAPCALAGVCRVGARLLRRAAIARDHSKE